MIGWIVAGYLAITMVVATLSAILEGGNTIFVEDMWLCLLWIIFPLLWLYKIVRRYV